MKKLILIIILILLTGCHKQPNNNLINGGFETGDLSGWQTEGEAYKDIQVSKKRLFGEHGRSYYQAGDYHLLGNPAEGVKGSLKSSNFRLTNTGYVSFLIAGGFNYNKTYVGLFDAKTNIELDRKSNQLFEDPNHTDGYVRVLWDASNYLNRLVYLKVVDEDPSAYYGYLSVDDFKVNLTESEFQSAQRDALIRLGLAESDDQLEAMNRYIEMNAWKISKDNRMNYHVTGQIGWINDPNGFVYYQGQNHLFYQHNPKDVVWGPMHWGHVVSDDLVKWSYLPIALAPDQPYDSNGVFSGSAIVDGDKLTLIYTGNIPNKQVQAIATSTDGVTFTKHENNPVINEYQVPQGASIVDFRDPKVWKHNDRYYMVIGSRQASQNYGQILMYTSTNLVDWTYVGTPYKGSSQTFEKLGRMWECPDIFRLGDKDVLIFSPQQVPNHRNENSTVYVLGNLNYETGKLENISYEQIEEIDYGLDFYAPQTMVDGKNRRVMVAWMQTWNRTPVTASLGYSGAMTLPRILELVDGKLYQHPVPEIENYRENEVKEQLSLSNESKAVIGIQGVSNELILSIRPDEQEAGVKLFKGTTEETRVYYNDGYVVFDRSNGTNGKVPAGDLNNITKKEVALVDGMVELRIFIDKYSVEVFINGGRYTMSSTVFPSASATSIEFYSMGNAVIDVTGYDLIIGE